MAHEDGRRKFFGFAFGGLAALGGVLSLGAMKRSWDPLPSVEAAGFLTVDLSPMKDGESRTIEWRGLPVFILKKTAEMKKNEKRDVVVDDSNYTVVIQLCTHLGCIPEWKSSKQQFHCACHGGVFDADGLVVVAPPPKPLDIPPFKIDGATLVLGEEGHEYKQLTAKA
ncbi:MAG: ubiquinol-cytochrome c reductase iron-sulfur subunit [Campylobacteraceae bacterium]|jgi:ubiquinol-cytochrome c reductase iron-sulfur subunit|nr:ubiquinol-cytochrome c reductase iron-sulfur subunit [Campylobacteraceae bacterium]